MDIICNNEQGEVIIQYYITKQNFSSAMYFGTGLVISNIEFRRQVIMPTGEWNMIPFVHYSRKSYNLYIIELSVA